MKIQPQATDDLKHLAKMVEGERQAMLTLTEPNGRLSSRPMTPLELDSNGTIWLFTSRKTLGHLFQDGHRAVNLAYCDTSNSNFVSIEGSARLVDDRARKEELWSAVARPWFPGGVDDPDLIVLAISMERAELWDSPDSTVVRSLALAASIAAAKPIGLGDHEVVTPPGGSAAGR